MAKRRVRHNRNAQLAGSLDDADIGMLAVKSEDAVFDLDGGDRVHGVRAADRVGSALRKANVADFAFAVMHVSIQVIYPWTRYDLLDELFQGPNGQFNGDKRIRA